MLFFVLVPTKSCKLNASYRAASVFVRWISIERVRNVIKKKNAVHSLFSLFPKFFFFAFLSPCSDLFVKEEGRRESMKLNIIQWTADVSTRGEKNETRYRDNDVVRDLRVDCSV